MATARAEGERQHSEDRGAIAVSVTLFADLRRYLPPGVDGPHLRRVPVGSTVADLLDAIGIPATTDITVGVDGELADRTDPLHDGADVMLLTPMEGG
jgi:sulfur carrier protein ThiS